MTARNDQSDRAYLVLADGTVFEGEPYGARGVTTGEAVFTTAMTGYQEVLTDPSYTGQLVCMTAPEIGNVGVNAADAESIDGKPHVSGFILRDASPLASNWRSEQTLDAYLAQHGIVAIGGIDTRRLTRHLRDHGSQNGAIGSGPDGTVEALLDRAKKAPDMSGLDLVKQVTPAKSYAFAEGRGEWRVGDPHAQTKPKKREHPGFDHAPARPETCRHVVAIDYGVKKNILRCLVDSGCKVTVVPASTSATDILALSPDGVFLSNGPGDPSAVGYAVETIRGLLGKKPVFGICLGHQLLALALGGKTYKLKFGHRGANQPVKDLATGRIEITTQNHGFCVDLASLPQGVESTHVHLNDGTSEGLVAKDLRAFSVQYHPEAAAGPHDSLYLFDRFTALMSA
jgi:carbamoyl-phosphate synthase small subunit